MFAYSAESLQKFKTEKLVKKNELDSEKKLFRKSNNDSGK